MARLNVYVPDDLARQARAAGLSVSSLTQAALRQELSVRNTRAWLARLSRLGRTRVTHEQILAALDLERDLLGRRHG